MGRVRCRRCLRSALGVCTFSLSRSLSLWLSIAHLSCGWLSNEFRSDSDETTKYPTKFRGPMADDLTRALDRSSGKGKRKDHDDEDKDEKGGDAEEKENEKIVASEP